MDIFFLHLLCCPSCHQKFNFTRIGQIPGAKEYGFLACPCSRYPVVAGIPIFKKGVIGIGQQTAAEVISLIEREEYLEALLCMLMPSSVRSPALAPTWLRLLPSVKGIRRLKGLAHQRALREWREHAVSLLANPRDGATAFDLFDFYFCRSGPQRRHAYDYFAFRFGQPRHLVALSLAILIHQPEKPILDLGCGFGHITRSLVSRAKNQPVIGVDRNFFTLYVAKNWIAPEAQYVCAEADSDLPFSDSTFAAALCVDGFHYVDNKAVGIRELKRLTQDMGLIMLVATRNALFDHPYAGQPLSPEGYQALVADMPHRLIADNEVLTHYLQKQGPPLARSASLKSLAQEPLLSVVASHREEVFQDYGPFEDWPHINGRMALNPLYREEKQDKFGNVRLQRLFPTAFYEKENVECKRYLPETVWINSEVLADLRQGKRTPEMEGLIEQCVLLGMPERY